MIRIKKVLDELDNIRQLHVFEDEWKLIFESSGLHQRSWQNMKRKLEYLNGRLSEDFCSTGFIEKLQDCRGLYSLKVSGANMNVRVFCSLHKIEGVLKLVLLHPFQEKNTVRGKQNSYNKAAEIAKERFQCIKSDTGS